MLIVIGILVMLAAILIPTILRAVRAGKRTATAAQLQSISVALEAFKTEHKEYPRVSVANTGAAVLCKALMAPGPASDPVPAFDGTVSYQLGDVVSAGSTFYESIATNPTPSIGPPNVTYWKDVTNEVAGSVAPAYSGTAEYVPGNMVNASGVLYVCNAAATGIDPSSSQGIHYWSQFNWADGGTGDRYRKVVGGALKSPFLQAGTFKVDAHSCAILDRTGQPVLYFPGSPAKNPLAPPQARPTYIANGVMPFPDSYARWDSRANLTVFQRRPAEGTDYTMASRRFAVLMGDTRNAGGAAVSDGYIGPEETVAFEGPYILWSAGPDGLFGPQELDNEADIRRCDDVTSFR